MKIGVPPNIDCLGMPAEKLVELRYDKPFKLTVHRVKHMRTYKLRSVSVPACRAAAGIEQQRPS